MADYFQSHLQEVNLDDELIGKEVICKWLNSHLS